MPYRSSVGEADGSIMPVIMTAHIAQSRSKCEKSHCAVIIHALAPVMGPYMSSAITTIHTHDNTGSRTSGTITIQRASRNAASRTVGGCPPGATEFSMGPLASETISTLAQSLVNGVRQFVLWSTVSSSCDIPTTHPAARGPPRTASCWVIQSRSYAQRKESKKLEIRLARNA